MCVIVNYKHKHTKYIVHYTFTSSRAINKEERDVEKDCKNSYVNFPEGNKFLNLSTFSIPFWHYK